MNRQAEVRLSIIVPVYNEEKSLPGLLESLKIRPDGNVEVIVVNDGSTDRTLEVIKKYKVKVFSMPSCSGKSAARNQGARLAKSPYLAFTDADCIVEPGWALNIVDRFMELRKQDPRCAAMSGRVLPKDNSFVQQLAAWVEHWEYQGGAVERRAKITTSNGIVCKEAFTRMGGFDEALAVDEDRELALRMTRAGYHIYYHPGVSIAHAHKRTTLKKVLKQQWYWGACTGLRNEKKYQKERNLWFLPLISHPVVYAALLPALCLVLTWRIVRKDWRNIKLILAGPVIFIAKCCYRLGVLQWMLKAGKEEKK